MMIHHRKFFTRRRGPWWHHCWRTPNADDTISFGDVIANQGLDVGLRLRQLREEQGLTIRALAEKSGLNVNTLSLIENGKTSPSVGTLQQLAFALQVPITAFFEAAEPEAKIVHVQAEQRLRAVFSHGTLEDLAAGMLRHSIQPFLVTLRPQADSGDQPIVHTGYEFVFCLQGCIHYQIEGGVYALEKGDSLLFEAHLPHRWWNAMGEPSQMLLVLCPLDERDRSTELHFLPPSE
jgi:transcriptional regulator with XRE-family HTH domain